jgi:hypothetical protein
MSNPTLRTLKHYWSLVMSDPRRIPALPNEAAWFWKSMDEYRELSRREGMDVPVQRAPVFFQRKTRSTFDAHYVYQAAWATKRIVEGRPASHVDVSSNIPFVAALSAVVPVRFLEFRPPALTLPGLTVEHGDILKLPMAARSVSSLSCLHVVEHVGLGRYGDPLDPRGMEKACQELGRVLGKGGSLFLSTPVGRRCTFFNMHRVSDPSDIMGMLGPELALQEFSVVTDDGSYLEGVRPEDFASQKYACGLYWMTRVR